MRLALLLLVACGPASLVIDEATPAPPLDTAAPGPDDPLDTGAFEAEPRCTRVGDTLSCEHHTWTVQVLGEARAVHWQVPSTPAPPGGYPAVLLFQGTATPAAKFWEARLDADYGLWHQVRTTQALLDAGYAVITPNAHGSGLLYWDTNQLPWSTSWSLAPDHQLMLALGDAVADGTFGDLDPDRLAAGGFSSGGYMTSRMAVSYAGTFRALFIVSASWATCGGAFCVVPSTLPADHPPTLFFHGERDLIVPVRTALPYFEGLIAQGTPARAVIDPDAGHDWLPEAPDEVVAWLETWLAP